jgi:hypothetical protein
MEDELYERARGDAAASAARRDLSRAGAVARVLRVWRAIPTHTRHIAVEQG